MASENLAFHWLIIISTTLSHEQIRNWGTPTIAHV